MLKTLLLSATFVGASVIGAAAQNSTPSTGNSFPSPATHCKDKATGQVRTKKAAAEDGSRTRMSGQEDTRGLGTGGSMNKSGQEDTRGLGSSGSTSMSGQEDTRGGLLQDCH
jgi:hypothetical protein